MTVSRWRAVGPWLGLVVVFACFSLPLFVSLGEWDMRNDEAIYSYAVQRILETGDWLTPRSIPSDWAFLEKPPLKFWLVAAAIKAGLVPLSDGGMRVFDALFGALAFLYVYVIGRRLAGVVCGVTAVFVFFTLDPLLFDHGLRSNNMEAAVVLGYCGGIYHFVRWAEAQSRPRAHAVAVAGYFLLAFMTKLVAALFLPAICFVALLWGGPGITRLRSGWRDWVLPSLVVLGLGSPWFVYQTLQEGREFWRILVGEHVYVRFTSSLDPSHLHPWHYYFTGTWIEVVYAGSRLIVLIGVVRLLLAAFRGESWLSRVVVIWGLLPMVAISAGTSKLLHYAYPFWPPVGLAAGLAAATLFAAAEGTSGRRLAGHLARALPGWLRTWAGGRLPKRVLQVLTLFTVGVVVWTLVVGPVAIEIGGIRFFRNSSVTRPVVVLGILLFAQGYFTAFMRLIGIVVLALLLPTSTYLEKLDKATRVDHPLRAIRDCMTAIHASGEAAGFGVLGASGDIHHHGYYYYFRQQGPWILAVEFSRDEVLARLRTPGEQTPVLLSRADYERLYAPAGPAGAPLPWAVTDGVAVEDDIVMMLPGPFARCGQPALDAGARLLWVPAAVRR